MGRQVTLDTTELDFDRILVKQRMSNGIKVGEKGPGGSAGCLKQASVFSGFEVANVSAVPVKWRLEATPQSQRGRWPKGRSYFQAFGASGSVEAANAVPEAFEIEPMEGWGLGFCSHCMTHDDAFVVPRNPCGCRGEARGGGFPV